MDSGPFSVGKGSQPIQLVSTLGSWMGFAHSLNADSYRFVSGRYGWLQHRRHNSVHLFALLDFGTGCIANIVFSFSGCRFAHLALFSWLSNIQVLLRQNGFCQHHLKYCGFCNYGGGDNYKRALIPRRSPTKRRANCARKWISPWCRKSYHVSLSNETNIQRKPKDENIPKLQ